MKKLLLTTLLALLTPTIVQADTKITEEEMLEYCGAIGRVAGQVMDLRQDGVEMEWLMETSIEIDLKIMKDMTITAYKYPKLNTKEYKDEAITDFKEKYYHMCVEQYYNQ